MNMGKTISFKNIKKIWDAVVRQAYADRKIMLAALVTGGIFSALYYAKTYSDTIQTGIAGQVVRFHVLANSDLAEDQALKLKVKEGVLAYLAPGLRGAQTLEETKSYISAHLQGIADCAESIITAEGYDYPVKASLEKTSFPTKVYGDVSFPAGVYEALRVEIGQAKGKNWWCVMFPPLCYVDAAKSAIPQEYKQELKHVLTDEEYKIVTSASANSGADVKIKFKIIEWWQNRNKQKDNMDENTQVATAESPTYRAKVQAD